MAKGVYENYGLLGVVFVATLVITYGFLKWSATLSLITGVVLTGIAWFIQNKK